MNHVSIMILCCATAAALLPAQESAALLHAPTVALGVDSPPFQKLGDFDGDGDLDVVGTRHFQSGSVGEVAVWRNDGGVFTKVYVASVPGMSWTNGASTMAVEVADLNGDGRDDFVVASRTRADRFLAQPYMQFVVQPWWLVGNSWGSRAITKGDFDGDGLVDIAVADPNGSNTRLFVFFGDGNWTDATVPVPMAQDVPVQLRASELDGQPGDELLLCSRSSFAANAYTVVNGQLVHQQQFTTTINIVSATPWLWAGGDIDQDGDADLVVFKPAYANLQPAAYQVFRRVGPASFVPEPVQSGGPAEYLADIDGDGDLDGVCCGGGGGGGPNYQWPKLDFASTFEIALNDGTGVFAPSFSFPGAGSESLAGVADLDGDGDLDLVAGRCVYYGNGPWSEPPMPAAGGAPAFTNARRGDLHDIDRDGDPDYHGVRNDGDGSFTAAPNLPAPPAGSAYTGAVIWCDVDGDGARDAIRYQFGAAPGTVWLRNNGGGHLVHAGLCAPAGVYVGGGVVANSDSWFVGDFDGDGDDDLVLQGTGQLYWNQGGAFSTFEQLPVNGHVDGVADFDGDGLPDIAMALLQQQIVLRGTGLAGASFAQVWSTSFANPLPFEPSATLVADLNGDGHPDILRPAADGLLRLLDNRGAPTGGWVFGQTTIPSPTLALTATSAAGVRPQVSAADLDGDGRVDLVASHLSGEPNVSAVLLRNSNNPNLHTYTVRRYAFRDGFVGDADGDGDVDVIGLHTVRNRSVTRQAGGRRTQRHDGVVGEGGAAPVLGGTGPYHAGGSHTIHLTGVPGPAVALLGISIGDAYLVDNPLPGLTLYLDPSWMLVGAMPITENGHGRAAAMASATLPIFPGTAGWTFHLQAFVPDPVAPSQYTQSNLLSLRIGN